MACFSGIGLGLIYLPAIVSVTYYFEKRRAFATGLAVCGSGLGTFIFAPLTKILVETYTWKGAVLIEAGLLLNCIVCGSLFRPMEIQTVKKSEDLVAVEQNTEEQCLVNGGVAQGSEKSRVNGHVPTLVVQSDTEDEVTPVEQAMSAPVNMRLLAIKSEVTGSAHSLPFHGAHASEEQSSEGALLRRHASDNLLHKVHRRKRTTTCTSHKSADERESPAHKVRPMARKDIFYTSSLHNIPMYRSNPNMYTRSIMSLHDVSESVDSDLSGAALSGGAGGVARCSSCLPASMRCSPEMRETFQQMMDFRLLKNPLFLLFAISNLFTSIGFCVPYTFLPDRAILLGINENRAAFLIAVIGIANTIGRVVFGWLSDRPCVNRLWLYNAALTVCGVSTALSAFCRNYETLVMYAACFGCFIGTFSHVSCLLMWCGPCETLRKLKGRVDQPRISQSVELDSSSLCDVVKRSQICSVVGFRTKGSGSVPLFQFTNHLLEAGLFRWDVRTREGLDHCTGHSPVPLRCGLNCTQKHLGECKATSLDSRTSIISEIFRLMSLTIRSSTLLNL